MLQIYLQITIFWTTLLLTLPGAKANSLTSNPPVLDNPSGCGLSLPINDFSCDASHEFKISVVTAPGTSMGQNVFLREVRLIVKHEWAADLDMFLISPAGKQVELSTDNGSGNDNYGNPDNGLCNQFTTFISHSLPGACNAPMITNGSAPFIGEFLPEESLGKFDDFSSPVGIWTLKICDDGKEHYGTLEFVELVFEASSCLPPTQVKILSVDSTTVVLDWVPGSNCDSTIIEFGPVGFAPGTSDLPGGGIISPGTCPPFTLTGLLPSFNYQFYIRENCGAGSFSFNACPVAAMTKCSPPPPTIVEDFNSQALCDPFCGVVCPLTGPWRNAGNDHFDWLVNIGPTSTTQTGPEDDVPGGGNYIYIETSGAQCRNGNLAFLVSDCIEVHAGPDSCDMSFDYILHGIHVNGLALEVTTNGGSSWQLLWQANGNLGSTWRKKFIDLDFLDGQTAQFRFVGKGGNGIRGDIAIDNLIFYGSELATGPVYTYYRDEDGDGFGNGAEFITTCQPLDPPPFGYVTNPDDCDDFDNSSFPGAFETPCDGIDNNCNGDDDEYFLLPVAVQSDTICNGETAMLIAQPSSGGEIFWYDAEIGGNVVHLGSIFTPANLPSNSSPQPIQLTFFAEEITPDSCVSSERRPASIVILPRPQVVTTATPSGCSGDPFDLAAVDLVDEHGVNGQLKYQDALGNEIPSLVFPIASSEYFIISESQQGCTDTLSLSYIVKPTPNVVISGDSTLCRGQTAVLTAIDTGGGAEPLAVEWNYNNQTTSSIQITNNLPIGQSVTYSVKMSGSNGCFDTASVAVKSVTSINAIQISTSPESTCNGADGEITLTPVGGVAPFHYLWQGGSLAGLPGSLQLSGLSQGAYAFTVTDSGMEGCNFVVPVVVVDGPSTVTTIETITPVSCNAGDDGCIEIKVVGTNPAILWSTGDTTELVCSLAAGTYEVTITDGNCENVLSIPLPEPAEPLFAKQNVQNVSCFGKNDGAIALTVFGGTTPYQFLWSNGLTTQNINALSAGVYAVTVMDARGCSVALEDLTVFQPQPVILDTLALVSPSCFGLQNGEMSILPQGGTPPYALTWSNGGTGSMLTNLASGSYTVTMTDARGCTHSQTIQLSGPPLLSVSNIQTVEPACNGLNNGSIEVAAAGGNGGYSYQWNSGSTVQNLMNIGSGQYQVTVTDQKNCTVASPLIDLPGPEFIQVAFNVLHPPCVGKDEGVVAVQVVNGGVPPFQYYWSTDDSDSILYQLPGGEYTVTVVDGNGCLFDTTLLLASNQPISVELDTFHLSCFGNASGRLNLTVLGGVAPFDITWSTGQQGSDISGLQSGNYQATITDNLGCKFYTDPVFLEQPEELLIELDYAEGNACFGGAEGSIQVSVAGGIQPYQYIWSNGKKTEDINGLAQGNYSLTVTDANGCVNNTSPISIFTPDSLQVSYSVPAPEDCLPFQVDTVCLNVWGGTAPYQFAWSTGDATACLVNVESGDYHATITDAMGCTTELMSIKVLEEFFPVKVTGIPTGSEKICPDSNEGSVAVVIEKGIGPFQFIWSNGAVGLTSLDTIYLQNLPPGQYNVTITDNIGCTAVSPWAAVTTDGYVMPSIPGSQIQHVNCKYGTNGSVSVNVIGGKAPYTFYWTNPSGVFLGDSATITGLEAGLYHVLVTDQNGCTGSVSTQILEPVTALSLSETPPVVGHVSCFGAADGTINLTPSGGNTPYIFQWSNTAMTEDILGLSPGIYTATVTDSNLCSIVSQGIEILSPLAPLTVEQATVTPVSCFNGADGAIDVSITGGTPPYFFSWGMLANTEDLDGVPAGEYHLVVADSNLVCTLDTSFTILQPSQLEVILLVTPAEVGQSNGMAVAEVNGGVAPYSFYWNNGTVGDTLANVPPGDYELTVTDANLCDTTIWVTVPLMVNVLENQAAARFLVYPNPNSGQFWLDITAASNIEADVKVFNPVGQCVFSKKEENVREGSLTVNLSEQPPGMYLAVVWVNGRAAFRSKVLVFK